MFNRVNEQDSNSRIINRALETRVREQQKKQAVQFQEKMRPAIQAGKQAKQQEVSREVLEKYAQGEAAAEGEAAKMGGQEEENTSPLMKQQKEQKTQKKQDAKHAHQDKQVEKKKQEVALDTAVQRKQQDQQQDSGGFSGGQGDFFQQAVKMGMAVQQNSATAESHPVQVPEHELNEMIDKISLGVDPSGASQFVIELKSGVLGGGSIQVSAQGKSVRLKFSGLDPASRQTVKNSSSQLESRLASKGLKLDQLEA